MIMVIIDPKLLILWAPYNFVRAQPSKLMYFIIQLNSSFLTFKVKEILEYFEKKEYITN